MKAIKQNDIIDVIYDSWYGLPLEEADKVVCDYVHGELIPIEWLKENYGGLQIVRYIMKDWEREKELNK